MSDFSKITEIKNTKKSHKCFMCLRVFPFNSFMYRWSGVFEGSFFHSVICPTCNGLLRYLDSEDGISEGDTINYMSGYGCNTPESLLEHMQK